MKRCDVCGQQVPKLAAGQRGRWGLDLCPACWQRMRARERAAQGQRPALGAPGTPFEWPACELCGGDLDAHGLGYYTAKGRRRRFCCLECRQTANSRTGAPIRAAKARERVRAGTWENPAIYQTPAELQAAAQQGAAVRAGQLRAALDAGTWQNPADAPGAREKLSRPRIHGGDPALAAAIEKLGRGLAVAQLDAREQDAHRRYRRERAARQAEQPANLILRAARQAAGLSKAELARRAGVALNTVWRWENHGAIPKPETRRQVAGLLGCWPWPGDNLERGNDGQQL